MVIVALATARASPTSASTSNVYLDACISPGAAPAVQDACATVCEPVFLAQSQCDGNAACTCTQAPPAVVLHCAECNLDVPEGEPRLDQVALLSARINVYKAYCGAHRYDRAATNESITANGNETDAGRAEDGDSEKRAVGCIFGLPQVMSLDAELTSPDTSSSSPMWRIFAFLACAACLLAERHRRKHSQGALSYTMS
ncbi:hypothetical protein PLICRDRAFT_58270 [Plicaturopsis crispa FD-325 SS-3]|uniref:Uncharacterized protein n=1 Tax=Plicaturopsis crispa FD-325 SS-3 TaxID=944288 RepID=A0A0C9T3G0_PLICR|nr:hypothetical protein PLICRDRAFT_58270 [Plicaturopsis crispa FD-325 SS-3]